MQPELHLPPSAATLKASREAMWQRALAGSVGGFAWEYSHVVDRYFEERLGEVGPRKFGFALLAVGGYGRGKLCPGSDIDILLLFKRRIPGEADQFVKDLLYPLWDLSLDLGHGVRTISDCVALSKKDFQVLASLLDARPLAGDADVFDAFRSTFEAKVLKKHGTDFAMSLAEHNLNRVAQYGDATGMLEPEIKNGLGGLRDGQQVFWLEKILAATGRTGPFLPEELARLRDHQAFLNRVRTALHLAAGRKNDQLFFDLQPKVARFMGFAPGDSSPEAMGRGVEFFLSRLHQAMTRIKAMRLAMFQTGFSRLPREVADYEPQARNIGMGPDGLFFLSQSKLLPSHVLEIFLESARSGAPLTWGARRIIRANPGKLASQLVDRPQTLDTLLKIFMAPHAPQVFEPLQASRILTAIFPDFGDVEHLIQFNDYHVHPVGRHTFETLAVLSRFLHDPDGDMDWAGEIMARLVHPERVLLAAFFHDQGKGEPHHSAVGAAIVRETLARYGRSTEEIEEVASLVESHLTIPKAATRSDLTDERVAMGVAEVVGTRERLDMLYLLSVADSMATGPRAWSSWTRSLLAELYFKTANLLERGDLADPDTAPQLVRCREKVRAIASRDLPPEFVDQCLDRMPPRTFLALDPERVAEHVSMARELESALEVDRQRKPSAVAGLGVNIIRSRQGRAVGTFELTVAALDGAGLFSTIAGALALHGLDIMSADLFTWKQGVAIDVFTVGEPPDHLFPEEMWARVSRSISYARVGKLDIAGRLEDRRNSPLARRPGPKLAPMVAVDNLRSDFHTIVEVAATDRLGLLYDLARTLAEHGVSIHLAKITTIKGRAADIFYVGGEQGGKIADPDMVESLKADLLRAADSA